MGNEHSKQGSSRGGLSGYQMRAVLLLAPVSGASLVGLEELMRTATQVKAQAEAERVLREQSGQSARVVVGRWRRVPS